jgi:transcriptional regulator with XRE-family HTH domain
MARTDKAGGVFVSHDERDSPRFGELLRQARAGAGLSQIELARASGVSAGHIAALETGARGHRPSRDTVIAITNAVGAELAPMLEAVGLPGPEEGEEVDPVEAAIRQAPRLHSQDKERLIDLYRRLCVRTGPK